MEVPGSGSVILELKEKENLGVITSTKDKLQVLDSCIRGGMPLGNAVGVVTKINHHMHHSHSTDFLTDLLLIST